MPVYPTAFVNSKVLHQNTFQSSGTVIAQGDVTVQNNTILGSSNVDTIAFNAKAVTALDMNNNNVSNVNNLTVNGATILGNQSTDTIAFYGGLARAQQAAITDLVIDNLTGPTDTTDQSTVINSRFNDVETKVNALLGLFRTFNLIAT